MASERTTSLSRSRSGPSVPYSALIILVSAMTTARCRPSILCSNEIVVSDDYVKKANGVAKFVPACQLQLC